MLKFFAQSLMLGNIALTLATTAHASGSGDMFGDNGSTIYTPPWVIGDTRLHHSDMFGPPNMYAQTSSDVFGHVRPPQDYGVEDMFKADIHSKPDDPLYNWPRNRTNP